MKPHVYWRWTLGLPLVCPAIAFGLLWVWGLVAEPPLFVGQWLVTVYMSGYLLGIPYAVLAVSTLFLLWSRPAAIYRRAALILPVVFALLLGSSAAVYFAFSGGSVVDAVNTKLRPFYLLTLIMGYAYVSLAFLGAWLLKRWHLVEASRLVSDASA